MASADSTDSIRRIVRDEIKLAITSHAERIARIEDTLAALGAVISRRGSAAPTGRASRSERYRKLKSAAERGDPSQFSIGERVEIRVGRGTYEGTVTRLEPRTGSVFVRRKIHGDIQKRPANTVVSLKRPKGPQRVAKGPARRRVRR